ncbi:MAG: ATP-dependent Clp protease ATP-binding subunit ClpA [Holophagaceae bacterium]|nr:ATP-dependent Clp protease ATP-binding subunit ClpA [Holophagaceae bacterium]
MNTPPLQANLQSAIRRAFELARLKRHELVTVEHLLAGLLSDSEVQKTLGACGVKLASLQASLDAFLEAKLEALPVGVTLHPSPSLGFQRVMERAILHALSSEQATVDVGSVLAAVLQEPENFGAHYLRSEGLQRLALLRYLSHGAAEPAPPKTAEPTETPGEDSETPPADPLKAYTVDLVARASEGKIDPLVGRLAELDRIIQILCRRRKNNPLLVGEPGVGKTAIAEGLALRLHEGKVPEALRGSSLFALDLGALLAGTRYRGDFEQRVKAVIEALKAKDHALLFIDEIHTIVGAGSVSGGSLDASNLLKPALAAGELRCIGATTFLDAKHSFDRDRALSRRFQKVDVGEPSEAEALDILKGLRSLFEHHHGVRFSDAALEAAVRLSARHLRDLHLPDKAIDVLDEAGSAQKLLPARKRKKTLEAQDIEAVVAKMARVPLQSLSGDDRSRLADLDAQLRAVIFGQDAAIEKVASSIKLSRSGLRGHEKPTGSFLFSGPTGVGKTELAKQLAHLLMVPFLRFDMSEYMEKHAVSRLVGAPPGYVGFDEGGLLTDAVRKNPHAVLLLDEIEKAHPDLFAILLQVMDHATLTDNHGRQADFRHVVLILTTNAGAKDLSQRRVGFNDTAGGSARGAIEKAFTPEFRNRLDAIVPFAPLGRPEILKVVDKNLAELQALLDEKNVKLKVSVEARQWLAAKGYEPAFGARPMARLIEDRLKKPLAEAILFGPLKDGGKAEVVLSDGEPAFKYR